jgi:hypothetical protein
VWFLMQVRRPKVLDDKNTNRRRTTLCVEKR